MNKIQFRIKNIGGGGGGPGTGKPKPEVIPNIFSPLLNGGGGGGR